MGILSAFAYIHITLTSRIYTEATKMIAELMYNVYQPIGACHHVVCLVTVGMIT